MQDGLVGSDPGLPIGARNANWERSWGALGDRSRGQRGQTARLTCPLAFPRVSLGRLHPRERQLNAAGLLQGAWLRSIREGPGGRVGERELSREVVVEVRHRGVVGEGGHLVRGDVWRAALFQRAQGAGEQRRRRRGLAAHVQARGGAGAEFRRRTPLEGAGVLVKLSGRVVLLLAVHG